MAESPETQRQAPIYTVKEHGETISDFLDIILDEGNFELDYDIGPPLRYDPDFDRPDLVVAFEGDDVEYLLANKAELLLALELLTLELLRVPSEHHARIVFDCDDYRLLRLRELRLTATTAADRVVETNRPFVFNPMNSRERRAMHLALRDREEVRSESASSQYGRYVVIYPAAMTTPAEPPPPPGPFAPRGGARGDERPRDDRGRDDRGRGDRGRGRDRRPPRGGSRGPRS